jgi:hypothetical protein
MKRQFPILKTVSDSQDCHLKIRVNLEVFLETDSMMRLSQVGFEPHPSLIDQEALRLQQFQSPFE